MRKLLLPLLLLVLVFNVRAQLGYEDFYSEKDLRSNLQHARTPFEKIQALGMLATKTLKFDSLTKEIYAIAEKSDDDKLMATAIWWDASVHSDSVSKVRLLIFANKHRFAVYQIAAYLFLSDYYHTKADLALRYARMADSVLSKSNDQILARDSLKILIHRALAHAYIHQEDIVSASRYLVDLRNYAEQDNNESLKIQALEVIGDMYYEGDKKRALPWIRQLYAYYKRTNQLNKLLSQAYDLGLAYYFLNDDEPTPAYKDSAVYYFTLMDKLADSLQAWGSYYYYIIQGESDLGMINVEHAIRFIDSRGNNQVPFSSGEIAELKTKIYINANRLDSAKFYLSEIQKLNPSEYPFWARPYYFKNKEYDKEIAILKSWEKWLARPSDFSKQVFRWFSEAYLAKKDYKSAYEYLLRFNRVKDSVEQMNHNEEIVLMETQKTVELQRATFNEQKKAQEAEQKRVAFKNKVRLLSLVGGIVFLLIMAGILWRNNTRKQRDKLKIEQAYKELKLTQAQLIQSEKMASLGELTAGIAHEIQNPLNFVNNFSEVSSELMDEMKLELSRLHSMGANGNGQLAIDIANDVKQNLDKVIYHGKRADAIVKGMLQHSRTSSGQKEPTDINKLADEYLRLAYHGIRTKDKDLSAEIKTEFDNSIGKLSIVPQDIGRVLLNLLNNAFYAVCERKKTEGEGYNALVSVQTRKLDSKIEVRVQDNGYGIPDLIKEKIFQPFFTTKPTGQGTGLGLSLAYDILKAHGGDIRVETKEDVGSEFIVRLPAT